MIDLSEEKSDTFNNKTKETLKCYIKCLSEGSKFSIISFGSFLEVHTRLGAQENKSGIWTAC
jgi:hypothetical protein